MSVAIGRYSVWNVSHRSALYVCKVRILNVYDRDHLAVNNHCSCNGRQITDSGILVIVVCRYVFVYLCTFIYSCTYLYIYIHICTQLYKVDNKCLELLRRALLQLIEQQRKTVYNNTKYKNA